MRLSPSFDTKMPDFSPRPSIPLTTVDLGTLKYSPPKLEVKQPVEVKKPPSLHQQAIDTTTFFKPLAQPKPSIPTLSHPKIKVSSAPIHLATRVEVQKPVQPVRTPVTPPPVPKLPPVEKPNLVALKKVIQSVTPKFTPPTPKPPETPIETKPAPSPHPPAQVNEAMTELKKLNTELKTLLNLTTIHKPSSQIHPLPPTPHPIQQTPKLEHIPKPEEKPVEEKPIEKVATPYPEPNIQELISKELEKVIPPAEVKKPTPEPTPLPISNPSESHTQAHPFQQPVLRHAATSTSQQTSYQPHPQSRPVKASKPSILANSHLWDFFLIRVNSKLNPYKNKTRGRIILGIKISGLILFALGVFIILSSFVTDFRQKDASLSLNVIFEALSTLTIAGILLFLGENLNLFFEPINPYKVREVI